MDKAICSVKSCDRRVIYKAASLCGGHYQQKRKGRPFSALRDRPRMSELGCAFEGCTEFAFGKGLCVGHYAQQSRHGDLTPLFSAKRPPMSALLRDGDGNKHCRWCDRWVPTDLFGKHPGSADGLRGVCSPCVSQHKKDRIARTRELKMRRFNLTPSQFEEIFASQGRRCATCHTTEPGFHYWAIDHDHTCCDGPFSCGDCIRGILCNMCNRILGMAKDDPKTFERMSDYLRIRRLAN